MGARGCSAGFGADGCCGGQAGHWVVGQDAGLRKGILDATRQYWQPTWFQPGGNKLPDLALIVAALPLLGWVLSLLGLSRRYH